ncbi:DUF3268 family zinc-finger domain-containing protein [Staphylococcus epidermidis]|nr:DUF3268 family zinc-finger domain-containing protein [Staphylococcus epidermidis]
MIDPRANNPQPLTAPAPLPVVSRRALRRVKDALPIPSACNCCGGARVELIENSEIYNGRSYGEWPYAYLCRDCGAYVGLHPATDLPLGTLADKPLREARNRGKRPFERIWRERYMRRSEAYAWLAKQLQLPAEQCHFGLFDAEQCEQARQVSEAYLAEANAQLRAQSL